MRKYFFIGHFWGALVVCVLWVSVVGATITSSGNVNPADPATWTSNTWAYIGNGTVTINNEYSPLGDDVVSYVGYIGYGTNTTGLVTVDGVGSTWTNTKDRFYNYDSIGLFVGYEGNGTLKIQNGGHVSNSNGYLGHQPCSTGLVQVDGSDSLWTNSESLFVGYNESNGILEITNHATVTVASSTVVSRTPNSSGRIFFDQGTLITGGLTADLNDLIGTGTINTGGLLSDINLIFDSIHGLNQTLTLNSNLSQNITVNLNVDGTGSMGAGFNGQGTLHIADGLTVASSSGFLGYHSGSTGQATVTGSGSTWSSDLLYVGRGGNATLDITDGGRVVNTNQNRNGYIGYETGSVGRVSVIGNDSAWNNSGRIYIGYYGNATLIINDGGTVSNTYSHIGFEPGSIGQVSVDGNGSTWTTQYSIYVGEEGNGTLKIKNGGVVTNAHGRIGRSTGSTGLVVVDGTGSIFTNSGGLNIGYRGDGTLTIVHNGLVIVAETLSTSLISGGNGVVNMSTGGMLALSGQAESLSEFFDLIEGTDAIQYWDESIGAEGDWTLLTPGTSTDVYSLEYVTDGELAGYTVLTVGVVPEPGTVVLLLTLLAMGGLVAVKRK